jgi:O-antigen ligase
LNRLGLGTALPIRVTEIVPTWSTTRKRTLSVACVVVAALVTGTLAAISQIALLVVVAALAAGLLALMNPPMFLIVILATFMLVPVTAGIQISPTLPVIFIWRPLILLGIAALYARRLVAGQRSRAHPLTIPLTLILVGFALSVPTSVDARSSFIRLIAYGIEWTAITYLTWQSLRSAADCNRLMQSLWILIGIVCTLGFVEFLTGVSVSAYVHTGYDPNNLSDLPIMRAGVTRVRSTFSHPIEFGGVLSFILPVLTMWAVSSRGIARAALIVLVAADIVSIALTGSLGPTLAAVLGLALITVLTDTRKFLAIGIGIVGVAAAWVLSGPGHELLQAVVLDRFDLRGQDTSQRIAIVLSAFDGVRASPLVGTGLNTWFVVHPLTSFNGYLPAAGLTTGGNENFFAQLLLETGLLGFGMVCTGLYLIVRRVWIYWHSSLDHRAASVGVGVFCGTLSFLFLNLTANVMGAWPQSTAVVWIVITCYLRMASFGGKEQVDAVVGDSDTNGLGYSPHSITGVYSQV